MAVKVLDVAAQHRRSQSRVLFDQLRRAAISVEANIVEGYALGTVPQFRRHLRIAFGSAAEAECLLRLAAEAGYIDSHTVRELDRDLSGTLRALRGLIRKTPAIKI